MLDHAGGNARAGDVMSEGGMAQLILEPQQVAVAQVEGGGTVGRNALEESGVVYVLVIGFNAGVADASEVRRARARSLSLSPQYPPLLPPSLLVLHPHYRLARLIFADFFMLQVLKLATLNELCETESVSWQQLLAQGETGGQRARGLSLSWANYNIPGVGTDEETVVCCGRQEGRDGARGWGGISMYYPRHLQEFYRHQAPQQVHGRWRMLQRMLEDHVDAIRFHEWTGPEEASGADTRLHPGTAFPAAANMGVEAGGGAGGEGGGETVVPATMPEWAAVMLCTMASSHDSRNDLWLSFLTTSVHPLLGVAIGDAPSVPVRSWRAPCARMDSAEQHPPAPGEATHTSITIFFELEKQQELVRRKIASLQRLMQCKLFVGQVEHFTGRLQKHAVDLFSGIRIKQETPNTLDTLCSQLSSLSMKCEESILQAMDAVKAVGEASQSEDTDALVQQQLSKIRQAHNAKEHVDRLKSEVEGAIQSKRNSSLGFSRESSSSSLSSTRSSLHPTHSSAGMGAPSAHTGSPGILPTMLQTGGACENSCGGPQDHGAVPQRADALGDTEVLAQGPASTARTDVHMFEDGASCAALEEDGWMDAGGGAGGEGSVGVEGVGISSAPDERSALMEMLEQLEKGLQVCVLMVRAIGFGVKG